MRRFLAGFSGPGASNRSRSWADSITTTSGFEFSVTQVTNTASLARAKLNRSQLLDETQQRVSRRRRRPAVAQSLCFKLTQKHRFAEGNELALANSAELHPNIQGGDRDQMGRLWAAVRDEGSPAFL